MKSGKKILLFIDRMESGGAQRQMSELAKGFRERGADVSILVYHDCDFWKEELAAAGIGVELIEEQGRIGRFLSIRRHIRRGGFDAVLSFLTRPNIISCLSGFPRRRWRIVVGERNADPSIDSFRQRLMMKAYALADFVTSNSYANMQMVYRALPRMDRAKTAVIYNVVDFERFSPDRSRVPGDGVFRMVVAARHHYQKNLAGVIEAVNLLPAPAKERLLIEWYGDHREHETFGEGLRMIEEYGLGNNFVFHGPTREIEKVLAEADAAGLFSLHEGLPNAVIEAMAMGKPVVASSVSDVPLLIGEKRLLCDPTDPGSMASSIGYLLSLPAVDLDRIGNENRRRALELFDKERILDQYLKILLPR